MKDVFMKLMFNILKTYSIRHNDLLFSYILKELNWKKLKKLHQTCMIKKNVD